MPRATFDTADEIIEWLDKNQTAQWDSTWRSWPHVEEAHRMLAARCIKSLPTLPPYLWSGDGIVIMGGGRYWDSTYVTIRMIRHVGCKLPIELWHFKGEIGRKEVDILAPFGVECIDADDVRKEHPMRQWGGWQAKPFVVLHSRFNRVLFLDADCYPVQDPTFLFSNEKVCQFGALFFPDGINYNLPPSTWAKFGMNFRAEPAFESGQFLIDKTACFQELLLTLHYNEHSDYYYHWPACEDPTRILYGDKDTFHMAWRALNRDYVMFTDTSNLRVTSDCYIHADHKGESLFVHRCKNKFSREKTDFATRQSRISRRPELPMEDAAWGYFEELLGEKVMACVMPEAVKPPEGVVVQSIVGHPISMGGCFNPGLFMYEGKRWLAYREGHHNARIGMSQLDKNWQPLRCFQLPLWTSHSVEDPRLFMYRGKPHLSYTDYDGHVASVGIAELREDWVVEKHCILELQGRQHWEKNWSAVIWKDELFMVYSIIPHQIIHIDALHGPAHDNKGIAHRVWRTDAVKKCAYGEPRGGAPAYLHNDLFYHFFHSVSNENGMRVYGIGVYTFETSPPFRITHFGKRPIMTADPNAILDPNVPCAIFPGGVVRDGDKWVISCGLYDRECVTVLVPDGVVEDVLENV